MDEKKICTEVLESLVPKVLPQKEDIMQYYLEMLPDYQTSPGGAKSLVDHNCYEDQFAASNSDNGQLMDRGSPSSKGELSDQLFAAMQAKKPRDPTKAAANLQQASDV